MIYDSNKNIKNLDNFDICIVGSGIAASTLVIELLKTNFTFIVVEAGGLEASSNKLLQKENIGKKFGLEETNSIEIGGTSSLWHGVLAPLDKIDFKKRSWIKNSGWPIDYTDLQEYYLRSSEIFKNYNFHFFEIKNLPSKLKKFISFFRYNNDILVNKIFQRPLPVTRFKNILLNKLSKSQNAHLIYNSVALKLTLNKSKEVKKLKCGNNLGEIFDISAKKFIVCAGALETPRLLLNSKINNANIGKYLMDHPMGSLCQIRFKEKQSAYNFDYCDYSEELKI